MRTAFAVPRRHAALLVLALACGLMLAGCGKTVISRPVQPKPPAPATPVTPAPARFTVEGAEAALSAGQVGQAEQIANQLAFRSDLTAQEAARAARVLSLAASASGHSYLAMKALDRWSETDPNAQVSPEWQNAFLATLGQLNHYDAQNRAASVMADEYKPFALRSGVALYLASKQWETNAGQALSNLQAFYAQAKEKSDASHMEHALFDRLRDISPITLQALEAQVTEENGGAYPYAVVSLESLRRAALHSATREEAQDKAAALAQRATLADPYLLRSWDEKSTEPTVVPLTGRTLALALPLSGPLGSVGKKIAAGAEEARKEFSAAGYSVGLVTVDTELPGWLDKLASFPERVTVVGGPLQADRLAMAHERGLTQSKVFLTFLQSLGETVEEGRAAWRFFSGPEDQLTALFSLTNALGISRYAVLMPSDDAYAQRMADRFESHVRASGGQIVRVAEYPKKEPEKWNAFIGSFLRTNKKATSAPATPHEAIFLPDSWRNIEIIVPNLFYFLETRQVLLGTALWEQGLAAQDHVAAQYYSMGVFPGAWSKVPMSRGGEQLFAAYAREGRGEPDFWAGLGYDFVRFASTLDIAPGWTPGSVNAALSRSENMQWSMAPLAWSAQGKASQRLFLFTPTKEGFAPANMKNIEATFQKAWNRSN